MKRLGTQLRDALKALGLGVRKADSSGPGTGSGQPSGGLAQKTDAVGRAEPVVPPRRATGPVRLASPAPTTGGSPGGRNRLTTKTRQPALSPAPGRAAVRPEQAVVAKPPRPRTRLLRRGDFHPHPLFADDPADGCSLPALEHRGTERQLTMQPENETDLIIGLDFGTSATKAVIRDSLAATGVFPVPLNGAHPGINGYLLPTRVFRTGETYSLEQGTHRVANLKLGLLACRAKSPVTEFNDCCAFLALVIRRTRSWLFTEHGDIYRRHALNWRVNLGLAARSYQDKDTVTLFRRLAWAAANLAADPGVDIITLEKVDHYRLRSLSAASDEPDGVAEFGWSDVDAVPEVSAQLQGFMSSARWDWNSRPVMMLVDVGAGTVDSAMFHVRASADGGGVLTFYSSRVEPNGAMNLHRARVDWLQSLLPDADDDEATGAHLASISMPTDRLRPIPESVREYLPAYQLEVVGQDVDEDFFVKRYRAEVAGSINDAKVGKGLPSTQLERVPLLLCGGGSRMRFYGRIGESINTTPGWRVSVEIVRLPVPRDLVDTGWHADDFDRLSVAYGLSLAGDGGTTLGTIVRAIDVPEIRSYLPSEREDRFVSKDQM